MKSLLSALLLVTLLAACTTPAAKWERTSIARDIHLRAVNGHAGLLAGSDVNKYFIYISSTFPVDDISLFLEIWDGANHLQSRTEVFRGQITPKETMCGVTYVADGNLADARLSVERFNSSTRLREITQYSLQKLIDGGPDAALPEKHE